MDVQACLDVWSAGFHRAACSGTEVEVPVLRMAQSNFLAYDAADIPVPFGSRQLEGTCFSIRRVDLSARVGRSLQH